MRAEDAGANVASEAAEAEPTESEVAEPVGVYTVLFIKDLNIYRILTLASYLDVKV
ncbi:hypothetical protein QWY15_07010 [Planococcus sp. N064]|uniref:Uncharacterized protein n=1 Tax=Planococcus liqunii TaxID=3058394 RepID=A0ABT8MQ69_9BACL|nr:hypothetical protein [Planococcus sp. N064]MDN7227047.1 hypothetical protein [Planococcus sp. N064]